MHYSVITVVWRDRDVIGACLDSVERQVLDGPLEVLVVDNASADGAAELVRDQAIRHRFDDATRAARVAEAEVALLREHYPPAKRTAIRALIGAGYAVR